MKKGISLTALIIVVFFIMMLGLIIIAVDMYVSSDDEINALYEQEKIRLINEYKYFFKDNKNNEIDLDILSENSDIDINKISKNFLIKDDGLYERNGKEWVRIVSKSEIVKNDNLNSEVNVTSDWAKLGIKKAYVKNSKNIPVKTRIFKDNKECVVIPLPDGYVVSSVEGENDLSKGVVIYSGLEPVTSENHDIALTTRDQFVWVPVDNKVIKYEKNFDWQDKISSHYDKYLDETGERGEFISIMNSLKYSSASIKKLSRLFNSEQEIRNSVLKYQGFYIGRYEAGIDYKRNKYGDKPSYLRLRKGKYVYNHMDYYNASYLASLFILGNYNVLSGLVTGTQWDTAITFIEKYAKDGKDYRINSKDKGNYSSNLIINTGNSKYVYNNIYDMAGNASEWINENFIMNGIEYYSFAGGSYDVKDDYFISAGCRDANTFLTTNENLSFRIALYIK